MSLKVATLQKHRHTAGGCSSASTLCGRGIHRFGATIPLLKPIAASMIKEAATGVEFPLVEKLWYVLSLREMFLRYLDRCNTCVDCSRIDRQSAIYF